MNLQVLQQQKIFAKYNASPTTLHETSQKSYMSSVIFRYVSMYKN